jgi:glucan phosphorylase
MWRKQLNIYTSHCARLSRLVALAILLAGCFASRSMAQQAGQKTFSSPEEASNALFMALQSNNEKELLDIFGPDNKQIVRSGDDTEDAQSRANFVEKYKEMHRLAKEPDGTTTLIIGARNWPTPITQQTFGYTKHTLLPEALERWSLPLFADLLPRHLEIIFEINRRFLDEMRREFPNDEDKIRRMSLIGEEGERWVRMANLAVVGSKAVNGVAELHTQLLEENTLRDFYQAFPARFSNKTNGVTPRRWFLLSNPALAALIDEAIGTNTQIFTSSGCKKMEMNGALTIGTMDGANIEIRKEVGEEDFFLFGLTAKEIEQMQADGYRPYEIYDRDPLLREVLDGLRDGRFSNGDRELFAPLVADLLHRDSYMLLADFSSYSTVQAQAGEAYADTPRWSRMSVLNTARSGKFSSDRTIREYCNEIWKVPISL